MITIDTSNEMTLKPILQLPQVLEISAYASFAFRHFLMDAVISKYKFFRFLIYDKLFRIIVALCSEIGLSTDIQRFRRNVEKN